MGFPGPLLAAEDAAAGSKPDRGRYFWTLSLKHLISDIVD